MRAILIKLGADAGAVAKHEIDLLGAGKQRAADGCGRNAARPLMLDPFDLRREWPRLNRYPENDFILDDKARDDLPGGRRLQQKHAQHQGHEAEYAFRIH
jgi:hypothetical protein